ncbi:MAG: hypothetical protein ACOCZJ_00490 [Thermoplasmatota archaeon]
MSTRKGIMEDVNNIINKSDEEDSFKIDKRGERVFFKNKWIDLEEDKETLYDILETKKTEMKNMKNSFLNEFQKSSRDDDETRDIARKIGELSTDIDELEELLD